VGGPGLPWWVSDSAPAVRFPGRRRGGCVHPVMATDNSSEIKFQAVYFKEAKPYYEGLALLTDGTIVKVFGQEQNRPGGTTTFVLRISSIEIDDDR
jgi:hypothetical protein